MPAIMVARSASDWMLSKGKAQYKNAVVPFVSDTCALIAGCIRKYRESSIYGTMQSAAGTA